MTSERETLEFRRSSDGSVELVGPWERRILVAEEFLEKGDPAFMYYDGLNLTIRVSNGSATYRRLAPPAIHAGAHRFALVQSEQR